MAEKRLLRAKDVCEMLGVPLPRFRKWTREGYFPSIRVGRARYFTCEMVDAWLRGEKQAPQAEGR